VDWPIIAKVSEVYKGNVRVHVMKADGRSRGITPLILNVGDNLRRVANITSQTLPPGKEPRYPKNTRLGGPQGWSGRFEEKKNPAFSFRDKQAARNGMS
jgi:hypothetical protein